MTDSQEEANQETIKQEIDSETKQYVESQPDVTHETEIDWESEARKDGWLNKDEHTHAGKDPKRYVDAKEYVLRKPFIEHIQNQGKEIRELRDIVKQSTSHLTDLRKEAYERAIKDLESRQKEAEEINDISKFKAANDEIHELKNKMQSDPVIAQKSQQAKQEYHPDTLSFIEKNKTWYNDSTPENKRMVDAAFHLQNLILAESQEKGEQLSVKEIMSRVENKIKVNFPHRFENMKRNEPPAVGKSTGTTTANPNGLTGLARFLDAKQRELANLFHRQNKEFSIEEYAKELDAIGRLKKDK